MLLYKKFTKKRLDLSEPLWYSIYTSARVLFLCPKIGGKNSPPGIRGRLTLNGGAVMRVKITLACTECKQRNYNTMKNKKNSPDRLEMNKYCRFCRKHTLHRETK